jgi:uncharacterized protein DUF3105
MTTELRRERREKQKRQRQRQARRQSSGGGGSNRLVMGGVVIGAIILAVLGLRAAGVFEPAVALDLNSADFQVPAGTTIGTQMPLQAAEHIAAGQRGTYNSVPPTSGQHYNQAGVAPATWGIKDSQLPPEVTTHNLEHGGIVIAYNNLTPSETDQLKGTVRSLMNGAYRKIILEPYPTLADAKVALTSWGWILKLPSVDQIQIVQFTRSHYADPNFAPEANVP